ncbi:MAG: hypothetical protein IJI14_15810 [Anaerolineaceae bacterium]|nr:hypothetical protein [Anaerolineaceae bacterium]
MAVYTKAIINIDQIINIQAAMRNIRFTSKKETDDPEEWLRIYKNQGSYGKYKVYVIEQRVPKNKEKAYQIVYGHKKLFAAISLKYDSVPVIIITDPNEMLDDRILRHFFNVDFSSLTSYEKGKFISDEMQNLDMKFEVLAKKTGYPYATLRSLYAAYNNVIKGTLYLKKAYMEDKINQNIINLSRKYFKFGSIEYHKRLTDFLIQYKEKGFKYLDVAVRTNTENIPLQMKVTSYLNAVDSAEKHKKGLPFPVYGHEEEPEPDFTEGYEDFFILSDSEKETMRECVFQNGKKGIRETDMQLYALMIRDGIVVPDSLPVEEIETADSRTRMLVYTQYLGGAKRAWNLYKVLESRMKTVFAGWRQPSFDDAVNRMKNRNSIRKVPVEYRRILHPPYNSFFPMFYDYLRRCINLEKTDKQTILDVYMNDEYRNLFELFCSSCNRYRAAKERMKSIFQ